MDLTEMLHEPTGMSFRKWLDDAHGLPNKEPIGLVEIRDVFNSVDPYDHRYWLKIGPSKLKVRAQIELEHYRLTR